MHTNDAGWCIGGVAESEFDFFFRSAIMNVCRTRIHKSAEIATKGTTNETSCYIGRKIFDEERS